MHHLPPHAVSPVPSLGWLMGRVVHRYSMGWCGPTHTCTHETHTHSRFYLYLHHEPVGFCNTTGTHKSVQIFPFLFFFSWTHSVFLFFVFCFFFFFLFFFFFFFFFFFLLLYCLF